PDGSDLGSLFQNYWAAANYGEIDGRRRHRNREEPCSVKFDPTAYAHHLLDQSSLHTCEACDGISSEHPSFSNGLAQSTAKRNANNRKPPTKASDRRSPPANT